jgi:hypothetical protein
MVSPPVITVEHPAFTAVHAALAVFPGLPVNEPPPPGPPPGSFSDAIVWEDILILAGEFVALTQLAKKYRVGIGIPWLTWLDSLGIFEEPYTDPLHVNDPAIQAWINEPAEKRRLIEQLAIALKHGEREFMPNYKILFASTLPSWVA